MIFHNAFALCQIQTNQMHWFLAEGSPFRLSTDHFIVFCIDFEHSFAFIWSVFFHLSKGGIWNGGLYSLFACKFTLFFQVWQNKGLIFGEVNDQGQSCYREDPWLKILTSPSFLGFSHCHSFCLRLCISALTYMYVFLHSVFYIVLWYIFNHKLFWFDVYIY